MIETADDRYERLLREARRDPDVVGVVLTGSRGKGFGTPSSDHDLVVVVGDGASAERRVRYEAMAGAGLDLGVTPLADFAAHAAWGGPFHWDRYDFAHAAVPVDKTGELRRLVDEKGSVPEARRLPLLREKLDAYVNGLYRSLKCLRAGNPLGARLEAADSIGHLLAVVFAREGRHAPYFGYLERELRANPLRSFPLAADDPLAAIAAIVERADPGTQQRLLATIDERCRPLGLGDVFAAWGADYDWMRGFPSSDAG